MYLENN